MDKKEKLFAALEAEYRSRTPKSLALHQRAGASMIKGGSHNLRLWRPYPFFMAGASGAEVEDVDGHRYIDYWQGHYANILGHDPDPIREALQAVPPSRASLHSGFEGESQVRLAETILSTLGYDDFKIRFTTAGTLAAMYAVILGLAHTGRDRVLKIGGGWHGASPFLLKGVKFHPGSGYEAADSAGIPQAALGCVDVVPFNDEERLEQIIREKGDRIGCFILEPVLGAGGFLPASPAYLRLARRLTAERGIVLIFDEIVSGYRFAPAPVQTLYGIKPDLTTLGKVIGGGHAVAAVAGRADILDGCAGQAPEARRVLFEGGTFSSHPLYMRAGAAMIEYLKANASAIYPRLAALGERLRTGAASSFRAEGIDVLMTGGGNEAISGSSLFMVHFPRAPLTPTKAEDLADPALVDAALREETLKLFLCLRGLHIVHGGGAASTAHTDAHIDATLTAYAEAAAVFKKALFS
jgi:glutamate-1-semialdehyde 2,1-aminomutase